MSTAFKKAFRSFLLADAPLAGLIGSRLYPIKAPDKPTTPYCVFLTVANDEDMTHDGGRGIQSPLIQISIFAKKVSEAE
jgi:hypothetical protein